MAVTGEEVRASIANPVKDALEAEKITLAHLAKKLRSELDARESKFFQKDGKVISTRTVVAWDTRQRARIDAHKLRGDYPAEKYEHTGHEGGPIEITSLGRATRIAHLIDLALRRKKEEKSGE